MSPPDGGRGHGMNTVKGWPGRQLPMRRDCSAWEWWTVIVVWGVVCVGFEVLRAWVMAL